MAIVQRTTVTTTRSTGFRSSAVPVWAIKLITVVIALVVLLLIYMITHPTKQYSSNTFIILALTCGVLLGWSIGSVLQQVFFIRTVEILVNIILTVLAILSLILTTAFLFNRDWRYSDDHKLMIATAVCFVIETIVCILMLSWAYYGNLIIVESR